MPGPYGVTVDGFVPKTTEEILAEIDSGLKGILGDGAGTEPDGSIPLDSPEGQLKTLITDLVDEAWQLGEAIYAALDPSQANDAAQDNLAALTGTVRNLATYSSVVVYCFGDLGTVLPSGRVLRLENSTTEFISLAASSAFVVPTDRTPATAYVEGDVRTSGSALTWGLIVCVTAGTSNAFSDPVYGSEGEITTDGTVEWLTVGVITLANLGDPIYAYAAVTFTARQTGPVGAPSTQLTDIRTPVSGWVGAMNALDATVGQNRESNALFRARRDAELAGQGAGTVEAIRAAVLRVNAGSTDPLHAPPTVVSIFYNDTDYVDGNGLPPHSVEVLVRDGTDADIAEAIYNSVAAGTETYGNQTSTVTDSEGNPQIIRWSRPENVLMYASITARYNPAGWPQNSQTLVAEYVLSAFLTYTNAYPIGRDVRVSPLNAGILLGPAQVDSSGVAVIPAEAGAAAVPDLLEVEQLLVGTSPSPSSAAQITITSRQVAVFDSSRTTVIATPEDP